MDQLRNKVTKNTSEHKELWGMYTEGTHLNMLMQRDVINYHANILG